MVAEHNRDSPTRNPKPCVMYHGRRLEARTSRIERV